MQEQKHCCKTIKITQAHDPITFNLTAKEEIELEQR